MQSLKKFSPESIRAIARNPNIDLQSIGIYSKSDIQHHIRTQQFQELLTQMDTIQRQSIDQNLRKLAETAGFADIYTQDYSGYFKDIKDYIYLNGGKYRPQDISPINIFSFVILKNEILAFLGWPYYILEKLTILYAMFNFIGFLFSLLKGIYNTCAIHTQVNRQASVSRILFAGFFGIFSSSINKILLDAQIKEYNTKISTRPNTYNEEHNNVDTTPTAPHIPTLPQNHPLSLVPRNFRNLAITHNPNFGPNTTQSPIQHIIPHHSQNDNTYEQIIEQPHTTTFQSQNNNFFSPQLGSLHRSNSHPANLQTPIPIIPLFAFPPPDFPIISISSSTNSDTNSDISVLYTISQLNNPNVETPDEFADSEPSPSNDNQTNSSVFSKPPFQPIPSNHSLPSVSTPSYASQITPTYSLLHSDRSYNNSPDNPQNFQELDNFITLQQQLIHPNTLTIHQLSSTIESSNPSTPTPSSAYTASFTQSSTSTDTHSSTHRAYRTFKRKFPNHPFPTKPGTA